MLVIQGLFRISILGQVINFVSVLSFPHDIILERHIFQYFNCTLAICYFLAGVNHCIQLCDMILVYCVIASS